MRKITIFIFIFIFSVLLVIVFVFFNYPGNVRYFLASLVFPETATPEELRQRYSSNSPVRILIVPGHDDEYWGAAFGGFKEADLTLLQGKELFEIFRKDPRFKVFLGRDDTGYMPAIESYFNEGRDELKSFRDNLKSVMSRLLQGGLVDRQQTVWHNRAPEEVSLRLYAINKWANDNDIEIVIHVHFNDIPRPSWLKGEYSGFSIYIPEKQLPNHRSSKEIAEAVYAVLLNHFHSSDYPPEKDGPTEDQTLIAVGANASLEAASLFIEYGYIYESQITSLIVGGAVMREFARQTYNGVKNYFEGEGNSEDSAILPHKWERNLKSGTKEDDIDILALQAALLREGVFPPTGFKANDCPLTGKFLSCTNAAVRAFQRKHNLPDTGFVGPMTREILNDLYSGV